MSPAHLALVTDDTPRDVGQLLLRPVIAFVEADIVAPLRVRLACRRLPVRRRRTTRVLAEALDLFVRPRRPFKFAQCAEIVGPCPFVSCRHHLGLDIRADGGLTINIPGLEEDPALALTMAAETCSLKVAAGGEITLEAIAPLFDVTPERISQISTEAERKYEDAMVNLSSVVDLIEDEWR